MSDEASSTFSMLKEEAKASLRARLDSPFLGAFIISWLVWNHRLVFVLFSSMDVDKKFRYVDEILYPTATYSLWMNIGGPLISVLVYIFLLPWVTELVYEWNLSRARRLKQAERRSADEALLSYEESMTYRRVREQNQKQIENMRQENQLIKRKLAGWQARATVLQGCEEAPDALKRYLVSQEFAASNGRREKPLYRGKIEFSNDGTLLCTVVGFWWGAQTWSLQGNELTMWDGQEGEIISFEFDAAEGAFLASQDGVDWRLSGQAGF
ncbi:hypothetical protein [Stenotrophomonas acidaminiphila]|uniref:hypothetical protein n=1 Tax=Stenotrophomonas acidaminiphila TaxID=128780 RepID=UPI0028AE70E1|nr:hypothetical protein [Stenotrophomonas acidaminiphila]